MTLKILGAVAGALLLTACADPGPTTAERSELTVRKAVVESVDVEGRQVLLQGEDGRMSTFTAGPEVRNLAEVEAGDVVEIAYYEAVALKMADPDDPGGGVAISSADRAAEGAKPGASAEVVSNMVVEVLDYNPETAIATFLGPDNVVHRTEVHPKMREFAEARKPGDRVEVSMEQAIAVEVREVAG